MRRLLILALVVFVFSGCQTTARPVVPPPAVKTAAEYREAQEDVSKTQADLAISGTIIEQQSKALEEGLAELEKAIQEDKGGKEHTALVSHVQVLQGQAGTLRAESENLTALLAQEREANHRLSERFTAYEIEQSAALSERETALKNVTTERDTYKGQRNTLLWIVITAGSLVLMVIIARFVWARVVR